MRPTAPALSPLQTFLNEFRTRGPIARQDYLAAILAHCNSSELLFISTRIAPLLKRDFLADLPIVLACRILNFVDHPRTLTRIACVSRKWYALVQGLQVWQGLASVYHFDLSLQGEPDAEESDAIGVTRSNLPHVLTHPRFSQSPHALQQAPSSQSLFKYAWSTLVNWKRGGRCLHAHRIPVTDPDPNSGVVTSVALDADWLVAGLANHRIYVFSTHTGLLVRTLVGHELGVWAVNLSARSDVAGTTRGWGQPSSLVVSGGCDKDVRVWDVRTGLTLYVLRGHTSTVRCLKVLHNRPIAVSGSRDGTLRVWDVQRGRMLRILAGHAESVRSLDVCGNRLVSGSYDYTCRLWDVDTGECLQVFRGHLSQIYTVAFDGKVVASGGLDTTVRVWDAHTGHCTAMLQGHTALVCSLQLTPHTLITGGADGRVLAFALPDLRVHTRIAAHDSSVTSLQFDDQFLVTGGNDGRVRLFDVGSGAYLRDITAPSETVWKVVFRREVCAVLCRRAGKTTVEIWSFNPHEQIGEDRRVMVG
ncbi:WD40-repeat-containing domain protein [Lactarius hengduanensis]|nr:WD40-repeat-containing domain protein [Lactarius hengduanensis]